jgi:outer membrane receptor for monomeric catechols
MANVIETMYDTAYFFQDDIKLTKKLTLTAGYRVDNGSPSTARTRPYIQEGYYNSFFHYVPLATPSTSPRGGRPRPTPATTTAGPVNDQSFFTSLNYKPTDNSTLYVTYDHVDAILGTSTTSAASTRSTLDCSPPQRPRAPFTRWATRKAFSGTRSISAPTFSSSSSTAPSSPGRKVSNQG